MVWYYDSRTVLRYHIGDVTGAVEDFSKAISLEGIDPSYYEKRSACYLQLGKNSLAEADQMTVAKLKQR